MVGHLKWNRGQVHTAVSKMSPEHLCWAIAEHKQTKGRIEMGQRLLGQELQLSMCPICLAQAEVLTAKLTFKSDQVQKWQFFQPNTGRLCLVPCTQSKAAQSWACAFSQAHLLYFGCRAAFSQQIGAPPSPHGYDALLRGGMWPWRPCVSEEPHTAQAMGINGKAKLRTSSSFNGSHCQEQVWGHNFPTAFISETPGIGARVTFHPDDLRTRMKTDVQCCFALELPNGIKVT